MMVSECMTQITVGKGARLVKESGEDSGFESLPRFVGFFIKP